MHTPKIGELVKIVADTCSHGYRTGTLVVIRGKRNENTFWVRGNTTYVKVEDIAKLPMAMRKAARMLEKTVRESIAEIDPALQSRSTVISHVLNRIAEEVGR